MEAAKIGPDLRLGYRENISFSTVLFRLIALILKRSSPGYVPGTLSEWGEKK